MSKSTGPVSSDLKTRKRIQALVGSCRANLQKGKAPLEGLKEEDIRLLQDRYALFSDARDPEGFLCESTLNIHNPATPRPYFLGFSNFSLNGDRFGSVWDQTGGGYAFFQTISGGEITRNSGSPYKPLSLSPADSRRFFLREKSASGLFTDTEGSKVDAWPLFPVFQDEGAGYRDFRCAQNRSHTTLSAVSRDIESTISATVPKGQCTEAWELTLKNKSAKVRNMDLFVKVTWDLRTYPSPRLNRGEQFNVRADQKNGVLFATNVDEADRNRRTAFLFSDQKFIGFDFSSKCFSGHHTENVIPPCVVEGALGSEESVSVGEELIGALHFTLSLKPGGTKVLRFGLGAAGGGFDQAAKAVASLKKLLVTGKGLAGLIAKNQETWKAFSAPLQVLTPDPEFDRLFNVWSAYQLMQTASFMSGAPKTEFREKMQILTALCPLLPGEIKKMLRETLGYQLKDGRILNRFPNFKGDSPDEESSMDNGIWMVDAISRYISETGDTAFLDETVGFYDPATNSIDNKKGAKVYDHIMAALRCLFDYRGRFGLCKVGSRDCNPALVRLSKLGGISAWLSMALVHIVNHLYPLARLRNQKRDVGYLNTIMENMYSNLNNYSWNGTHYTYAYDDNGEPIGGKSDKEGTVHLASNLWAVICGAARLGGNLDATLAVIDKLETAFGHRSVYPSYSLGFKSKGGIPDLLPGTFENGAIDTFNRASAMMAFSETGQGDKAYQTLKKGLSDATIPDIATASPSQLSEFIIGPDHADFGKHMYDIYNPAVARIRLAMERMTGVIPVFEGLWLSPCIPAAWGEFTVRKVYRGVSFSIRFHNPLKKNTGVRKVTVNGRELEKTAERFILDPAKLPSGAKNKPVCVDVLMG